MRWERLFADLEGSLEAEERRDFAAEVAERAQAERASLELASRLAAMVGQQTTFTTRAGRLVSGTLTEVAQDWVLLASHRNETLVPIAAIAAVHGLEQRAAALTAVERRMRIGTALRALADAGAHARVETDGGRWDGVIEAVGADHLDLDTVGGRVTLTIGSIVAVVADR
ncbi:hypothetical protein [Demequina pelophila]|uniref:hypothetical protein n=1 Tax=Demequina pelophila TaxID=1638984 RepID=UPI0007829FFD|nr:hypothetical protein [Demequina pelophila]